MVFRRQKNVRNLLSRWQKNGKSTSWYANGQIEIEENYNNGLKQGNHISFYESGTKIKEGVYINNKKDGKWIECHLSWSGKRTVTIEEIRKGPECVEKMYDDGWEPDVE